MRQIIFLACVVCLLSIFATPTVVRADTYDKLRAETHLKRLRDGTSPRPTFEFYMIIVNLEDGGLLPEDIGTDNEELEKLRVSSPQREARIFLEKLREGKSLAPVAELGLVLQNLALANLAPEAIGTSREELESLRVAGHRYMATLFLARLREGSDEPLRDLSLLQIHLQAGGLTFTDVGTSQNELMAMSCGTQCAN